MKSFVQFRPNEVDMSALEVYFEKFNTRPKLIIKSSAARDHAAYPIDDEDEDDRKKVAARIELFTQISKQFEAITKKHELDMTSYHISFPENHYDHIIHTTSGKRDKIVFESSVSKDSDPVFTLLGESRSAAFEELELLLNKIERPKPIKADTIHIVAVDGNDFWLNGIDIKNRQHDFTFDNYNDDFKPISDHVINSLRTAQESGLVLFHGGVGTGKTSYMKYLLNQVTNKKIIYIPPDMVTHLSSPSFVSFLIRCARDSILLVEDAETVLQKRQGGQNQSVSNILNISDGILGDVLQMQLVCTFNCSIENIDPALLRPGRLIAEYKFDKLSVDKTQKLLAKLYGTDYGVTAPLSIAEIYNYKKLPPKSEAVTDGKTKKPRTVVIQSVGKLKKNAN